MSLMCKKKIVEHIYVLTLVDLSRKKEDNLFPLFDKATVKPDSVTFKNFFKDENLQDFFITCSQSEVFVKPKNTEWSFFGICKNMFC
jgi:hypothetical protein